MIAAVDDSKGGMLPSKPSAAARQKTHIIDGRLRHAVLLEIFTHEGVGTEVVRTSAAEAVVVARERR